MENKKIVRIEDIPKENIFQVPSDYFENFAILPFELEEKEQPFLVPDFFFEEQKLSIEQKIFEKTPDLFSVPDGYFEKLSDKIFEKIESQVEKKTIPLYKKWLPYVAAASVIAIICCIAIQQVKTVPKEHVAIENRPTPKIDVQKLIDDLPKNEVQEYLLDQNDVEAQEILANADVNEKKKILSSFSANILPHKLKKEEKKAIEMKLENIDITDLDIEI